MARSGEANAGSETHDVYHVNRLRVCSSGAMETAARPPPRPRRRPLQSFLIALNRSSASAAKQGGGAAGGGALVRRGAHFAATVGGVNRVNRVREMKSKC